MKEECLICKAPLEYLELGIKMELSPISCEISHKNNQCLGAKCPFHKEK